jgi:hypothetical protein
VLLALAGGLAVAAYLHLGEGRYFPVARIASPEGLTYTAFSEETRGRSACIEANQKFVADFRAGCPACQVTSERCESKADAIKLRVAVSDPVVLMRGMSLAIAGPRDAAAAACKSIVEDLAKRGVEGTRCLN